MKIHLLYSLLVTCLQGMEPETKLNHKKLARLENKKKKMIAFLEIAKLNDADRLQKSSIKSDDSEDEPSSKKLKTEDYCYEDTDENNTNSENLTAEMTDKKSVIGKPALTGEEYEKLRKELKERKKYYKNFPAFRLKTVGEEASISVNVDDRTPIFLSDIQNLILFTLAGNSATYCSQRWCTFDKHSKLKHTIVFVVENLSLLDYQNHESLFPNLNSNFPHKLEIITPSVYKGDLIEEIAAVPLTTTLKENLIQEYGSLELALESAKVFKMLKAVFPVHEVSKEVLLSNKKKLPESDKFPRTHLLLSAWQLVEECYPIPLKGSLKRKYINYVMTKDVYSDVTDHSPLFALDCEMCRTTSGQLELTRVSVVNEKHELIYEKLVKPYNKITDYLTQFSGITAGILKNVTTRIEEVQRDLRELLPPDAILVGQSLNSDLHALKLIHPYIIDTSIIFNVTGDRHRKTKLKVLAKEFLDISIQTGNAGHNSIEDSLSSLKLVQLKLRNYLEFGDAVLSGQKGCLKNFRGQGANYFGTSLLHHVTKSDKNAVVISKKADITRYGAFIHKKEVNNKLLCIEKETNKQIVKQIRESSKHFDITLAHVNIAEDEIADETIEETCKTVDKYVQRIWQHCPLNTLCIVLFGGNLKSNGVGFINLKKDVHK